MEDTVTVGAAIGVGAEEVALALDQSSLYVVRGVLRLEFEGHEGWLDAQPGDFVHVPAWTVHRESNPTTEPSLAVIARVGGGIPTVNVDGPTGSRG